MQCRIRPILATDVARGEQEAKIQAVDSRSLVAYTRPDESRTVEFDRVHDAASSNADVFQDLAGLIGSFIDG